MYLDNIINIYRSFKPFFYAFRKYGNYTNLKISVVLGGVNQKSQVSTLKQGVDILATQEDYLI